MKGPKKGQTRKEKRDTNTDTDTKTDTDTARKKRSKSNKAKGKERRKKNVVFVCGYVREDSVRVPRVPVITCTM